MSRESLEWLQVMTLIGQTLKRAAKPDGWHNEKGQAWHYRESMQGDEPNHYEGDIPIEDIRRRLFNWKPVIGSVDSTGMNENGVFTLTDKDQVHVLRPPGSLSPDDPGAIMNTRKSGYKIHDYDEWLIKGVESILDDGLSVSAAGLLREGAQAWVEVSVPDTVTTPEGVEFRPNLLASTSLDSSIATGYACTAQLAICDNTLAIARAEKGRKYKVKHTVNSLTKIADAREALGIIFEVADDFAAEVAELTNTTVTDAQWAKFLDETNPIPADEGRSRTMATNKRAELEQLYRHDPRSAPWTGTAFGVLQAMNTYLHHHATVRGMSRAQRNMANAIEGKTDKADLQTLESLNLVLATA